MSSGIICVLRAGQLDVELDLLTNRLQSAEGYLEMQNMSVVICLCEEDLLGKMKPKLYSYTERQRKRQGCKPLHILVLYFLKKETRAKTPKEKHADFISANDLMCDVGLITSCPLFPFLPLHLN